MKESQRKKVAHDARFDDIVANQTKIFEMLASMFSQSIERDEQKAIDREMKAKNREVQLQKLAMMNGREQRSEDNKIMSMDMSNLTPMQKSYYEDLQRQIVAQNIDNGF
ncbi:unnamed protein product [Ilex paraguariensis]|uniref:No apical meristem-associated C-terminal domain-containing protein n=1 Tax=Ilex paraguariensis TaxID=185542 RepID=A0ABC8RNE3_9AQUA